MPYRYHEHMDGPGWGAGGVLMLILMVLLTAAAIALIWSLVTRGRQSGPQRTGPEEILAERLARGEIDPDEYRMRLAALNENRGST